MPTCWIIAGPNGAGKTTFALQYLPKTAQCTRFINADSIAAGLSPLAPERELVAASRIFLKEIEDHISSGIDFAFETTLAGRGYLRLVQRLVRAKWRVELVYLALPSSEMSRQRVSERVAHGGHNIPAKDIDRRFPRSLHNLFVAYGGQTSRTRCFMNNGRSPIAVFDRQGENITVFDQTLYQLLTQKAGL